MSRVIGLDFGTTNSAVGVIRSDRADKVDFSSLDSDEPHPSVVWYSGGSAVVGREAKRRLTDSAGSDDAIRSPKRLLGQEQDVVVAGRPRAAEEVVGEVLRFLREGAARHDQTFDRAVVTIPVALDGDGRRQLRAAAGRAGFRIEQFVHEPHAALFGYLREHPETAREMARFNGQHMMVVDWGGGTLDVTLCRLVNGVLAQVTSAGDDAVGGDWFDRNLMHEVRDRHAKLFGLAAGQLDRVPGADARLWEQCELAKKELSSKPSSTVYVPNYFRGSTGATIKVNLSRGDLDRSAAPLLDAGFGLIERVLEGAGLNERSVALCLATGGMARMPAIRERLLERFGLSRLHEPERGDLAIAGGAAWIAHDRAELRLAKPIEVLLASGNYVPLLRAGAALPREGKGINLPDLDLYCADPRDGHAKVELARPVSPTAASTSACRKPYGVLLVRVDPTARPLLEPVALKGTIDHDLVARLSAISELRRDKVTLEVTNLEFGLALHASGKPSEDSSTGEPAAVPGSKALQGAVMLRSNITVRKNSWPALLATHGWADVPGELISEYRSFIPWSGYQLNERQRNEEAYYRLCGLCKKTMYESQWNGCDDCAARQCGLSTKDAAKRRALLLVEWEQVSRASSNQST